jgi:hypothetical protein
MSMMNIINNNRELSMLLPEVMVFNEQLKLHVINITSIDQALTNFINKEIVEICEGQSNSPVELTKANFTKFLLTKDIRTQHGAVAEFFIHLYLRQLGFKQEFLFFNLEEGSIKKGFDGYFTRAKEEYLVESKSGSSETKGISHKNKLKEAYDDLSAVVAGKSKKSQNNPWKNAFNHASHIDVGTAPTIRAKIKQISDLYDQNEFKNIALFNVIPCSTVFLEGAWADSFSDEILNEKDVFFNKLKAKSTNVICITKNTFCAFNQYLKG